MLARDIIKAVKELCININYVVDKDTVKTIKSAVKSERSAAGRAILRQILKNDMIAAKERVAVCQDTGIVIAFVELGQGLRITGGNLNDAINEGVRQGYSEGFLRKSVVRDPLSRINTGDNTPAVIHTEIVPGRKLKITLMAKGAGSENMSAIAMLPPSVGCEGIKEFVIDTVRKAGANPCPPIVVGIGIGGTFESVALLAKKALLRPVNSRNSNKSYDKMEKKLLMKINKLGIGPQGMGGTVTALAVHIETSFCHIASLPVAINMNCHVVRHGSVLLPVKG